MEANHTDANAETKTVVASDGEEYTATELENISDWWEEKALEATKEGDDWGYEMAREKMMKAQSALTELRE